MLKAIGFVFKCTLFAVVVLILGNWVKWDGHTASERVTRWIHQARSNRTVGEVAEKVGDQTRRWARGLTSDAKAGAQSRVPESQRDQSTLSQAGPQRDGRTDPAKTESISPSERQKLRALIRELNSSHRQD
jgi:hypothetical protein